MTKMVLIVDDSSTIRQQVANALQEAGFAITEAGDGAEGLNALGRGTSVDMVICDVHMPVMNGLEFVEKVKSQDAYRKLPILMLTTEAQPAMVNRAKAAGAVGWIVKPFDAKMLVASAKHLTGA